MGKLSLKRSAAYLEALRSLVYLHQATCQTYKYESLFAESQFWKLQ